MWNLINAQQCLTAFGKKPERILIVGCGNKGEDAKAFNEILKGDVEIIGVDIIDDIGSDYRVDNVTYIQQDVTELSIRSSGFDIAYSFATFEHICNLQAGWQNMLATLKSGGMLWSVSSPLWMTPYGHHKREIFEGHPYVHLRYPEVALLIDFCKKNKIIANDGIEIIHHINYMMNIDFFNKLPPTAYEEAAKQLSDCEVIWNSFDQLSRDELIGNEDLILNGFLERDLLSQTHRLTAIKS